MPLATGQSRYELVRHCSRLAVGHWFESHPSNMSVILFTELGLVLSKVSITHIGVRVYNNNNHLKVVKRYNLNCMTKIFRGAGKRKFKKRMHYKILRKSKYTGDVIKSIQERFAR